ncbi:MAG: glycosyltransferase, partial [Flavobacteriales bacterium]
NVHVAANLAAAPQSMLQLQERNDVLKLCTVARVSEEKNLLGGLHLLIDSNVKAEWNIYGVTQNQEYVDLLISLAENHDRIELNLHGEINPNDLNEALKSGHFFYLPTLGENYGHSIVESFMHGIPVIISNKTPWNKLEEKNCGWDLDLSSDDWSKVFQRASSMQDSNYSDMRNAAHEYGKSISKDEKARQAYMAIFGN